MSPPLDDAVIEVAVPVFNEQAALEANCRALAGYLELHFPFRWRIVIVDNGSTDGTPRVAERLAESLPSVSCLRLAEKGRGRALRAAWSASTAEVLAYMDVDLSTNLESFHPLVAPLLSGHSDLAIGTRLAPGSHTTRRLKRELLSRGYNALVHLLFRARFSDAQCGFKAIRADAARNLVPLVEDEGWFFDTELLLLAERNGLRIYEVPVDWIEDLDSRVDIGRTALDDLKGLWRVRRAFWRGGGRVPRVVAAQVTT